MSVVQSLLVLSVVSSLTRFERSSIFTRFECSFAFRMNIGVDKLIKLMSSFMQESSSGDVLKLDLVSIARF